MTGRMEVVGRVSGRRRWSDAEKLEILAEAFRPEVRVYDVIARREVSSSLIYTWRKQLREGKLARAERWLGLSEQARGFDKWVAVG
ncbi:transposase [Sphingomonas sp. Leaf4]|uniref:transposase n=1 Tax=Sphingomonas sp. Leaf4 TaxID=2876553 RepID=UPI001E5A6D25|nr:transposase [Sphingomonas sp. Leaf4]